MVNKKGGKKHKRGKKDNFQTKELRKKDDGQEYAQIKTCKGNCRFDVMCFDGIERIATLCGTMRKRKFEFRSNLFPYRSLTPPALYGPGIACNRVPRRLRGRNVTSEQRSLHIRPNAGGRG